ncbi:MAG: DUF3536 domain-containing protein [Chroococcidiopsidaceae cyanobacterium CP_BM_ER_R8_30]|nr:DUF3536 domain-containing protein [Chroococcidiopsidaceae cyanobacterium CP_BM_ER_R8_30]
MIAEGIRFIVLAPSQAQRCRPLPTDEQPPVTQGNACGGSGTADKGEAFSIAPEGNLRADDKACGKPAGNVLENGGVDAIDPNHLDSRAQAQWHEVGGSQIDPTRPYRCFLKSELGAAPLPDTPYIDIFFYDGPISRDMGFRDVLYSSHHLAGRIAQAVRGDHRMAQLISVATDGETFGHHKGGTEKTLAYAFLEEFPRQEWTVTNFAHYLSLSPPTWEVELKPVTAWSCAHGVDRWQEDCGCGGEGGVWHQKWRRPLRNALDWLRDQLIRVYEETGRQLFRDPWGARDAYIEVVRDRSPINVSHFLSRHQNHKLSAIEQVDALRLLEMQRHALLMYTSCGWFFEELSRPEGTQILRYAARALELAGDVAGVQLEKGFLKRLAQTPSNVEHFRHGAEVYRRLVVTAQISFRQVAAQRVITSLFGDRNLETRSHNDSFIQLSCQVRHPSERRVYCYTVQQLDYQLQRLGPLTLSVGQLRLVSEITWESEHLVFAVLHLGGSDFHCCIQPFSGRRAYSQLKEKLFEALQQSGAAHTIVMMTQLFGDQSFSLQNLFAEERHRIMRLLSEDTLTRLDQLYTQVYRDNYSVLMAFHRDELPVPQELQVAAEIALGHRCLSLVRAMEQEIGESQLSLNYLAELEAMAIEAKNLHCRLDLPEAKHTMEQLILRSLWQLFHDPNAATLEAEIRRLERLIEVGDRLNLNLSLDRAQELYSSCLPQILPPSQPEMLSSLREVAGDTRSEMLSLLKEAAGDSSGRTLSQVDNARNGKVNSTQTALKSDLLLAQSHQLLQLGQKLAVGVSTVLNQQV